jgi:hypothetical protein
MKDQNAKADVGKPDIYLVPPELFEAVAKIRMYGNEKYHDPDNWQTVEIERYYSAVMRHLLAWRRGEDRDKESGYSHLWHAACNLAFMIALEDRENEETEESVVYADGKEYIKFNDPPHEFTFNVTACKFTDPEGKEIKLI